MKRKFHYISGENQLSKKNWSDERKLEYSLKLHKELSEFYEMLCKMVIVAIRKNLKMVIENPYTQPHYLTTYWCLKPTIIDKDRTQDGDYFKKPTQYWFINFKPKYNLVFEPLEYVEVKTVKTENGIDRKIQRSLMHPQYANRFIRKYLIDAK